MMTKKAFDPNAIGIPNGNYFSLPFTVEEAALVIVPVPWDATTSYHPGTAKGPQAILDASTQIDLYDLEYANAWEKGIGSLKIPDEIMQLNTASRPFAEEIIAHLEQGGSEDDTTISSALEQLNLSSETLNDWVYQQSKQLIAKNKLVGILGGEHSAPFGLIKALSEKHAEFGILQIDAHADLRVAYEGFTFSHASIMYNTLQFRQVKKIVQISVRDISENEFKLATSDKRIELFDDYRISRNASGGTSWEEECKKIISHLPELVYISFDIDGLNMDLCPNTGTPVPGGLSFQQATYLLKQLHVSGKKVIGFDLCEVAPGEAIDTDAVVGSRILFKLCNLSLSY